MTTTPTNKANQKANATKPNSPLPNKKDEGLVGTIQGIKTEWGKISWPTWPQVWGQTIVVLVLSAVLTFGIWVIDNTYRFLIDFVVKLIPH